MQQAVPESEVVNIDLDLASEAKELNIDMFRAAMDGICRAIEDERRRLRQLEAAQNKPADHDFVEMRGIPMPTQMPPS
jgi:antitoxin CcdA